MNDAVWVIASAADMHSLAADVIGPHLRAGDLIILSGPLGAGKTTFTQGIGRALGVRGAVSSPTFIIARVHPSLGHGPALVHVDAYRLTSVAELDDLDLDESLEESVTVVEWGEGKAEALSPEWLHLVIERPADQGLDMDNPQGGARTVRLHARGKRWQSVVWGPLAPAEEGS